MKYLMVKEKAVFPLFAAKKEVELVCDTKLKIAYKNLPLLQF